MKSLIVADTGPLIILAKIGHLQLLAQRYKTIRIPQAVMREATAISHRPDSELINNFATQSAEVIANINKTDPEHLDFGLDDGETQAILLAKKNHCAVLMDEKRGRLVARRENVPVLGTIGLLLAAKQEALIVEITPLLDQMQSHGYRLSDTLIKKAKRLAGEE